jgi:outer membrane lipoprotein SlyB
MGIEDRPVNPFTHRTKGLDCFNITGFKKSVDFSGAGNENACQDNIQCTGTIMRTVLVILTCVAAISLLGCSSAESYHRQGFDFYQIDKVAVVDVIGPVGGEAAKNQIADFFVMELLKKGYSPIERSQVQILLNEQKFQASDITTSEGVTKAGEILNVPVVLFVNVPEFGQDISLTVKMVDVQDGSILWMGAGEGSTGKWLSTIAGAAAGAVVGAAVTGDDDQVVGAVAGGALGGVAGNLLSPKEEKVVREITEKICTTLPVRR